MTTRLRLVLLLLLALPLPAAAQGSLSVQVLRLLLRDNTWTGQQTISVDTDGSGGLKIAAGTPTDTSTKLYNIGGSLFWDGTLLGVAPSGIGTVTSVALTAPGIFAVAGTPVTTTGTLALTLATQTAATVWAGPTVGPAATPTFRALIDTDIPDTISISGTNNVSWASVNKTGSSLADLVTISASVISTGTLPDGRFPATLPAASGANLTALNASALSSGALPAARLPALTGDVTTSAGAVATTLASTGVGAATYGSATQVPQITVDAKGRITAAANVSLTSAIAPSVISGGSRGGMLVANAANAYAALNPSIPGQMPRYNGTDTVWSLDGSTLTGLNATQLTTGVAAVTVGGTGLTSLPTNGQLLIGTGAGYALNTLTGTANQVIVTNGVGNITLTLPQAIATSSAPQFARIGAGTGADAVAALYTFGPHKHRVLANGSSGATFTLNLDQADVHSITLTANTTLSFAAPVAGTVYRFMLLQDGTGSRTVTWPTIKWAGGSAPTLTTTAAKTDIITCLYDGTSYYCDKSLNY